MLLSQALNDQTEMESYELADQVNYTNMTVEIYQPR